MSDGQSEISTCIYVDSSKSFNSSCSDSLSLNSSNTSSTSLYSESDNDSSSESVDFSDDLHVYYTNADNLLNKFDEFEMFISLNNVDVAVVTEVFPKNLKATNIDCCEYSMKGFTCFKSEIEESSRGVVIYVRNTIPADYCSVLKQNKFKESVWCVLRLSNGKELLIGGVYKSPSSSSENVRQLNALLTQASALNYEHLVVLGDFNFPEIDWDSWTVNRNENHPSFSFIECLRDNFLTQHVNFYTRYRDGQDPSCLDLLLSDNLTQIEGMKINGKLGLSDHISFTFKLLCPVLRTSERVNRPNFFKGKYEDIRNYLNNVSWVLLDNMNIEESWTYFVKHINVCVEKFIPKTVNGKKFQKPKWMDFYCVKKVKKKYHAWRRFTHSHSYRDYQAYCKLRNSATKAIRFSKKKYQKGVAECSKTNPKAFWSYVKGETKSKTGIGDLVDKDGNQVTENEGKANVLNDFFASVFTREDYSNIPPFDDKVDQQNSISDIVIQPEVVLKHLKSLNTSKACGPDDCHPFFLKQCSEELYKPLSVIFQKSIESGLLPQDWKLANVSCIFKKGDRSNPGNYRPVSLTSVICKMLERIIRQNIVDHLNENGLLSDCQFGFRKNRNTILQLLSVLEDWTEAIDKDLQVDTVYLDFSKAFDSVPHRRLLKKVESYGISGKILVWLQSFLSDRLQRVVLNGHKSNWNSVISGIPQGSVLGPILFIIFVNDLPDVVRSICKMFADDCKVYTPLSSRVDQQQLQEDIDNLCQWSKDWLLKFNVQKCKVVSFGRKRVDTDYHMTDRDGNIQQLKREDSEKDLGVLFTESLSFEKHISNTLNKANMIIGLIRRKFTHIDNTLFLTLYKSLIRSHLDYGNLIYFPITKKCKQMIENAQRRATRLIPELRGLTYNDRLRELNLPSLDFRRKRFDMIQVFRIVHNIDDISMTTFFTFADNSGTRGHNLKLFKPKARKSLRQNSFGNRTVSTWNNLPHELVNTTSVNAFKAGLDKLWKNKRFDTSEVY